MKDTTKEESIRIETTSPGVMIGRNGIHINEKDWDKLIGIIHLFSDQQNKSLKQSNTKMLSALSRISSCNDLATAREYAREAIKNAEQ